MRGQHTSPVETSSVCNRVGRFRWVVCALLFFATTVNYVDRQVIGILKPTLQHEIGWNDRQYGNIVTSFQLAYAVSLLLSGPIVDRIGTRLGYALALTVWSIAATLHGAARSVAGFAWARFLLGLGEGGNFPAAVKTVAEWFPKRERALAVGIFNSGTNVGAILAPLTVPWIAVHWGWPWAFYLTGGIGLLWLLVWLPIYRRPEKQPLLSAAEFAYIRSDPPETGEKVPWRELLPHRQTWAFVVGKFLPDAVWYFYLFWAPDFLDKNFHVSLTKIGLPLVVIYLTADVGSIAGGWLSSRLIQRGWTVNAARKLTMLLCVVCILPVTFAPYSRNMWTAVLLISLAAAAHQGWSANVFTLASDMFPRRAVGSVVGLGGMAGAVGGIIFSQTIGRVLQWTGSYIPIFYVAGAAYLLALPIIDLLAPKLEPVDLDGVGPASSRSMDR